MIRAFFLLAGIAFGFVLIYSGVSNYDVIRDMFLFRSFHLYGVLGVAVIVSFLFVQLIKKLNIKALLTKEEIDTSITKPDKYHVIGGLIAGAGWALTGACPGPALAQIGYGTLAGLFTFAGIMLGVYLYGRNPKV
ncbi:MAG: hypothetical protein D6767_09540 [Candidatus Hydrogenedentota bacterium]|nr:MAG: hypothetical protein D6767_09540 [Candidatus Hydrogenedentota bacterium]